MKIRVVVEGKAFEVEVGSLSERPVVAVVDGERFEVWPEGEVVMPETPAAPTSSGPTTRTAPDVPVRPPPRPSRLTSAKGQAAPEQATKTVFAPIPGVIQSVSVKVGEWVEVGRELCVLEAMKMKNPIKASRAGEIARVHVSPGQHVKHHDALMEYVD